LGPDSFWAPYIDLMPDVTFFCDEDEKYIKMTMDPYLMGEAHAYKKELDFEW
jgi:hypothetical protein